MKSSGFFEAAELGLSIVIPCYQSESTLRDLVTDIQILFHDCNLEKFETLLVLDGPTDGTAPIARELESEYSEVRVIELTRNFGQHAAIYAGIVSSKYGLVITMDDDGQHHPSSLAVLIDGLNPETDIVYGLAVEDEHSFIRNLASRTFKTVLFRFLGVKNAQKISALRLFRKSLLKDVDLLKINPGVVDVALHWNTTKMKTVATEMSKRSQGKSNYTIRSLSGFAIKMIIGYSVKPLKFALVLGLLGFIVSVLLTMYFLFNYLNGEVKVAGFSTITILITSISSIQLITLGILGEYIANIHQKSIGKPTFSMKSN